ncbi:MAG: hypothetical protein Q4F72_00355 [Desulfovibrionaceae bacterium]|nr:hypothetical protein [Desulfovibrionaceae bacterium]
MSTKEATCQVDGRDYPISVTLETIQGKLYDRYTISIAANEKSILLMPAGTATPEDLQDFIRAFSDMEASAEECGNVRCYVLTPGGLRTAYAFGIFPNLHTPDVRELCLYVWSELFGAQQRPPAKAFYFASNMKAVHARLTFLAVSEGTALVEALCCQPSSSALAEWVTGNVAAPDNMFLNTGNPLSGTKPSSYWAEQEYGK